MKLETNLTDLSAPVYFFRFSSPMFDSISNFVEGPRNRSARRQNEYISAQSAKVFLKVIDPKIEPLLSA